MNIWRLDNAAEQSANMREDGLFLKFSETLIREVYISWEPEGTRRNANEIAGEVRTSCVGDELYGSGSRLEVVLGGELESPLKTTLTEPSPECRRQFFIWEIG